MYDANQFASALRSKRAELAVALTSLLLLVGAPVSDTAPSGQSAAENLHMRARVGHFAHYQISDPLANIYMLYFDNVLKNSDSSLKSIDINDWRRARPSGAVCLDLLRQLRVRHLNLARPFDIVAMDACLDWLFGDERHSDRAYDKQNFSRTQANMLKQLEKSEELRQIYESTKFKSREVPEELKNELYSYLTQLFKIHGENPQLGCHGEWLETYVNFIENVYMPDCDNLEDCKFYGLEDSRQDSYLRMLADSTIKATKDCYDTMLEHIGDVLKKAKEERTTTDTFASRLVKSAVRRQQEQEKWTHEMIRVLQMAQGVDKDTRVELGEVAVQLENIKEGDEEAVHKFTTEVENYANENVDFANSEEDYNGRTRYGTVMADLCRPFVDYDEFLAVTGGLNTDNQKTGKPFDFYKIVYSLVRVTNYEELVGISSKQFEEDIIKNHWEAVYLATFACHVIFNSWGEIGTGKNSLRYEVQLVPEASSMLAMWPIEVMSKELPIVHSKSSSGSSSALSDIRRPKGPKFLRRPFAGLMHKKSGEVAKEEKAESKPVATAADTQSEDAIWARETLELWLQVHHRFPMSMNDNWLLKYPLLVNCLPATTKKQYEEFGFLSRQTYASQIPSRPDCKF